LTKGRHIYIFFNMKYLNWDPDKNEILKVTRGISFEEIAILIGSN